MPPRAGGFTLIELAIVMAVLGVVLSLATVVLPRRGEVQAQQEASRLVRVLDALQREALLQGRPAGLRITGTGYETLRLDQQHMAWEGNAGRLLAPRDLGQLGLALALDGAAAEAPAPAPAAEGWPDVVFDAAGVAEPIALQLQLAAGGIAARVVSDGVNRARLQ